MDPLGIILVGYIQVLPSELVDFLGGLSDPWKKLDYTGWLYHGGFLWWINCNPCTVTGGIVQSPYANQPGRPSFWGDECTNMESEMSIMKTTLE